MTHIFKDRRDAGQQLAATLRQFEHAPGLLVLGLPRGGLPVAAEVARALGAPLDVMVVRKLGVPGHEELAMGAIAPGGVEVLNQRVIKQLGIRPEEIARTAEREQRELERRELAYREGRPQPEIEGRTVILVDDGLATGATMAAAVAAVRRRDPVAVVVAVPVASAASCAAMKESVDVCVCAETPEPFYGVGQWYENFSQTTDDEVRAILAAAAPSVRTPSATAPASVVGPAGTPISA